MSYCVGVVKRGKEGKGGLGYIEEGTWEVKGEGNVSLNQKKLDMFLTSSLNQYSR